jgi:diguanylate cyclase (GGDEF)-like protein
VDDQPENVKILTAALMASYEIISACNGEDALKLAGADEPPDLILLDVVMPEMDGYEVCRRLKADEKTKNIPVIFITAQTDEEAEAKGLEVGAVDYVAKPFSLSIIRARVKTHVELKQNRDTLERLLALDDLTGISNRRRFEEVLEHEWRRAKRGSDPLSLIMMDVDCFKEFNDNYGHAGGDDCLKRIAKRLEGSLKRATDFVARYGGDEFVAILADTDAGSAAKTAEMLRQKIHEENIQHEYSDISDRVTMSFGIVSVVPECGVTSEKVREMADKMLYEAKKSRNQVKVWDAAGDTNDW